MASQSPLKTTEQQVPNSWRPYHVMYWHQEFVSYCAHFADNFVMCMVIFITVHAITTEQYLTAWLDQSLTGSSLIIIKLLLLIEIK